MGSEVAQSSTGPLAVLSIGTNSTRMLVADMRPDIPHSEIARSVGTRIGEGLGERGDLGEEPMERTLSVLREYAKAARDRHASIHVIATSALRRAGNSDVFAQRVREATGESLRILRGEEEAAISFRGAAGSLPSFSGCSGVVDIGGGSTEYAVGTGLEPSSARSYEIGAVRITEQLPALSGRFGAVDGESLADAMRVASEVLAPIRLQPSVDRLLLVGGSATTAAAVAGLEPARAPKLSREILSRTLERLCAIDLERRKQLAGMPPQRADILPAGIILLATTMEFVGRRSAIVVPGDLLLGMLLQERDRANVHLEPREAS